VSQGTGRESDGSDLELTSAPADEPASKTRQAALPLEKPVLEFGRPLDAPSRRRGPQAPTAPADEDRVGDYRHPDSTRTNIPEAGLATQDRAVIEKSHFEYRQGDLPSFDPHEDPQLIWAGKAEHTSFDVDSVSLHIHERVSTAAILRAVRREEVQRTLFSDPQFSLDQELAFYQHEMDWANRLILGDSLLVMNSLLRREGMAGNVQCIYIDPPYGVNYNSNFQPRTDQRDVKDGDDRSLTREPEQIRAYRDTWQLGVHSYLTYLRDRLLLARELLTESGSVFVQIGDQNEHLVRGLLDEVFGASNFVEVIAFVKTGGLIQSTLPATFDLLLWYAKDRAQLKSYPLYASKGGTVDTDYSLVELPDQSRRRMTADELRDPTAFPAGARIFQSTNLESANPLFDFEYRGRTYRQRWKTNRAGLERLAAASRLFEATTKLRYVRYLDDFPVLPYTNVWTDTGSSGFREPNVYVVQTVPKVIGRCILMTTDPGDLVFDPTCGSGTTAYVAEQWGRRWITCDTSRVALALARQRLMTASYEYYQLADSDRGVDGGFRYRTVPHVMLQNIAQNEPPEIETLYDQPLVDHARARVAGPYTVEQIPSFGIDPVEAELYEPAVLAEDDRSDDIRHRGESDPVHSIGELVDLLRIDGVRLPGGRKLDFVSLAPTADGGLIHAEGEFDEAGERRRIAVSFGPLHGPIGARQVEDVLSQAVFGPYHAILFAGFAINGSAQSLIQNYRTPKHTQLLMANIAADVLVPDLLKNRRGQQLFAVFGEPDVSVRAVGADEFEVEVRGMDVYDPATGEVTSDDTGQVAAWLLDQDYDRRSFLVSQAFFPGASGSADPWERLSRALRGWVDPDAFEMLRGTISLPFRAGKERRVAVKVIDFRGNEAIRILDLPA
jgi:adenine-specific DNA-methyltransferase